ncbi:MAG: YeeE/YedE family protein [Alcaligenaceae bacterium]
MTIDWSHFTPWTALSGGLLLGLASALFILLNGRNLGISGILGGLIPPKPTDAFWRLAFLAGLFSSPWVFKAIAPSTMLTAPRIDAGVLLLIIAGLLVGLGTRYGSGCTSGHGVCGLARLSSRSLIATLAFMAAGFAVVFIARHLL